ncbi:MULTISPECIES: type IV toxin-antitoxin system AbiEi family antitoxin domain-containing protein [Dehalobacter]|nr:MULTISPECIES: type IV toxin-antitoxin system AbiEi family antitoxin domain-containing protein [Dehalobacter]MDJ0306690.1 type IV toxin-antitoxin system AbiEi family antitoxin domain-containing protein [Dehalobacter sp.]
MMKTIDKIKEILKQNNGIITASQVTDANISRHYLKKMLDIGALAKVDRGIYIKPKMWEDKMYILQYKYSRGIFSHETALYIHGLTDRIPQKYTMTFPYGYHTHSLKEENVIIKKSVKDLYELGLTKGVSPCGNPIRLYDVERTLCDIVKGNNTCDIQIVNQAMKQYAKMPGNNIPLLFDYAEKVRVKPKILNYMEVLL